MGINDGVTWDLDSSKRIANAVRLVEANARVFAGISSQDIRPGMVASVRTPAIPPATPDGKTPILGKCVEDRGDGTIVEICDCYIMDANGAFLSASTVYEGRMSRVYAGSDGAAPLFLVQASAAAMATMETVFPWRILQVNFPKGDWWSADWSSYMPVYVKNARRWFEPSSSTIGNYYRRPDCSKWKEPGDPYYTDETIFGGFDNNLDLFIPFCFDPAPSISTSDYIQTYPAAEKLEYQELYYAAAHYMAPWNTEALGSPVLSCKFTDSPAAYIIGYGGKKIPLKWNYIMSEYLVWVAGGKKVIASPFVTLVKPSNPQSTSYGYGVTAPLPYIKKNGQQANLYFWFDDPFNLLNRTTTAYQRVLVTPVLNFRDGVTETSGGTNSPRTKWTITQIYHQSSPNTSPLEWRAAYG